MADYLSRRGNRYSFRRVIPLDIQSQFGGRTEVTKALGTSDPKVAEVRCRQYAVTYDTIFAAARQAKLSADSANASVASAKASARAQKQRDDWERAEHELHEEATALFYQTEEQEIAEHDRFEDLVAQEISRLFAQREALRRFNASVESPPSPAPGQASLPQPSPPVAAAPAVVAVGKSSAGHLAALVEKWAGERKPKPRTVRTAELVVERFYEHVGRIPVANLTRAHIISFKDAFLAAGQTPANTNKHLELLSTLLAYAVDNLWAKENVAYRLRVAAKKNPRGARISFDLPALQAVFSSPVYAETARPVGGAGEAAYWLPLLGLLTGARLEELAQLRPDDIYSESYHDAGGTVRTCAVLRITDAGEGQGVKNAGSVRRIPIHPELLARGFVEYARGQQGKPRIFPGLVANKYGEESAQWSKWFGKYLRNTCKIIDSRMVFHSFRHGFKDACRECGISREIADALQGHVAGGASGNYGGEFYPLRPLVEATANLQISGLHLPTLSATSAPAVPTAAT